MSVLGISLKAVSSKTTMKILECVFIEAFDGKIKITTNNMELCIETILSGRIDEEGKAAIEAKMFSEIVRSLPNIEDLVDIYVDENYTAHINCGNSKFKIAAQSGDDFPVLPAFEKNYFVEISRFSLKEIIRQTIFAISDNENSKVMTGEHFEINDDSLTVTALDGHRIAIRKIKLKNSYEPVDVIIPGKTMSEISKILDSDFEKTVKIYFTSNSVLFEFDDTVVLSRLIEGKYLNITKMVSFDYSTKVNVDKKELLDCIDRATLLVKESDKKPVIVGISDERMTLNMNSSMGSFDEEIYIEKTGDDMLIGFNPKFLLDILRVIDDEKIDMYLTNPKSPCFFRNEEESYTYLVLPVNFSGVR